MASFEDAVRNAVPGGNLAAPIAVAIGALVLGKLFGGGSTPATQAPVAPAPAPTPSFPTGASAGGILGGLGDLIGRLSAGGAAQQVNSWVGPGANEPIQPGQLGGALGSDAVSQLAARTGLSQHELLKQLAAVLPQVINHLTPNGRVPTLADLEPK